MSTSLVADNYNRFLRLLETTNGRDKTVRLLQYGSRFLSWWLLNQSKPELAKRFSNLESHSSLSRKVFRLLKSLSYVQAAWKTMGQEEDSVVQSTGVVQNICLALWLYYDHIIWAAKIGLVQKDVAPQTRKANIFWLIAMIMGIVKSAYQLNITQQLSLSTQKPEALDALNKRKQEYVLELLRNLLDVPIPLTALNQQAAAAIPTGIVGLCGTITSIIGMQQVWSKTK